MGKEADSAVDMEGTLHKKCLGLPVFIKRREVTTDGVIKRDAGREGVEGCRGIDDGFGRGYNSIQ